MVRTAGNKTYYIRGRIGQGWICEVYLFNALIRQHVLDAPTEEAAMKALRLLG